MRINIVSCGHNFRQVAWGGGLSPLLLAAIKTFCFKITYKKSKSTGPPPTFGAMEKMDVKGRKLTVKLVLYEIYAVPTPSPTDLGLGFS